MVWAIPAATVGAETALSIPWKDMGAVALVTLFVIMFYTGRVISRASYNDICEQRDAFKAAWKESQETVSTVLKDFDSRLDANTDALRAVESALTELRMHGERNR